MFSTKLISYVLSNDNKLADPDTMKTFMIELAYSLGSFILPKYMIKSFSEKWKNFPIEFSSVAFDFTLPSKIEADIKF